LSLKSAPSEARRELGLWSATALVVGHTIGVGIFLTPSQLISGVRSPALTLSLWILCGLIVFAGALTFGELSSRYPYAGGPYVYLREAWGPRLAFLYGWQSLLIMDPGVTAVLTTGFSQYLVVLWPAAAGFERWFAIGLIWMLAGITMAGLKLSARVFSVMTAFKLLALAAIVVGAFAFGRGSWSNFDAANAAHGPGQPLGQALAIGLVSVFFSFAGFWEASRIAGDVRNPSRTLPQALAIGVGCLTAIYALTTAAFIYLVPASEAEGAAQFAQRAGEMMLGPSGPMVLAAIVLLSVVPSAMALLMMAPRVYLAMSADGLFPAVLASVNTVTHAPIRATIVLASIASVFVLLGTFEQVMAFLMCATLGFIALAAAAQLVLRRRPLGRDMFVAPGSPFTAILFVLLIVGVVALVAVNRPFQAIVGSLLVLLGLPAYEVRKWLKTQDSRLKEAVPEP